MKRFVAAALGLALSPLFSYAQTVRVGAAAEARIVPAAAPGGIVPNAGVLPLTGLAWTAAPIALSVAPAPSLINAPNAAIPALNIGPAPSAAIAAAAAKPLPVAVVPGLVTQSVAVSIAAPVGPLSRSEKAVNVVRAAVASWGEERRPDAVLAAASVETPDRLPAPPAKAPNKSRPGLSKALTIGGSVLVGVSLAASGVPALLPAAVVAVKGALTWTGLGALAASRFWREPGAAPDVPRGPPAPDKGSFSSFKVAWAAAKDSAAAQKSFGTNVGGSSVSAFRDWFVGGLRTGLYWMAPSLLLMLGGAILAKASLMLTTAFAAALAVAAPAAADAAINTIPLSTLMLGFVPTALAAEAAVVALYFGVEWAARQVGLAKAAPWLGFTAALAAAAVGVLSLTPAPFIVAVTLALEAGVIWSAARSRSFIAPLALRGILTLFSIEAARLSLWLKFGAAGVLVGLPAVWGGVAVAALVALAWTLKSPGMKLAETGSWWNAPDPGQRPKSPGRLLSAGLVWGLVVYAVGDLVFWGVNAIAPGHEPAPAILAKMLTSGVDLVLYNFVIVGLLEEYVFRRGLFKTLNDKLEKWGLTLKKAFWLAAIASALIFSGVHYVDWGAVLAKIGMGDPAASSGLGGAYDFTWAGFAARSVLGVLLAWMYKRSGLLLIPIVAHFWADSMEGLGLRWGFPAFLALAAGALVLSFLFKPKPKQS